MRTEPQTMLTDDDLAAKGWDSIVCRNLLRRSGYTPYCGSMVPRPPVGNGCDNPRTQFDGEQFICPQCGWRSSHSTEFIAYYKCLANRTEPCPNNLSKHNFKTQY